MFFSKNILVLLVNFLFQINFIILSDITNKPQWDFNWNFIDFIKSIALRKFASLEYGNFSLRLVACYFIYSFPLKMSFSKTLLLIYISCMFLKIISRHVVTSWYIIVTRYFFFLFLFLTIDFIYERYGFMS